MPMPSSLRLSLLAWTLAVAAGVAETGLAVTPEVAAGGPVLDLLPVLALRGLVYGAAAALVIALARRRRWARTALAICLSTIGLASMALPLLADVAAGDLPGPAFLTVRGAHIAAAVIATAAMSTSSSSLWLAGGSTPSPRTEGPAPRHSGTRARP